MDINEILQRVGEVIGSQANVKIAKALNVAQQTSSNWKARQTIPWRELYLFAEERSVSMAWLLTGEGSPRDPKQAGEARDSENRMLTIHALLDLLESEPYFGNAAAANIELLRRLRALEQRVAELEAAATTSRKNDITAL